MVWGGKGANGTWFSDEPEMIHGINWLPITGASLYLGRYPDYCAANYAALVAERRERDEKKRPARSAPGNSLHWNHWGDLIWVYWALSNPRDALAQFEARPANFKTEAGNSLANTYAWITALDKLGQVDRSVTADTPFYAVFQKEGRRTHVAYNWSAAPRTVTFSDGATVTCAPRSFGQKSPF
jgi:endoglucanase Acf2